MPNQSYKSKSRSTKRFSKKKILASLVLVLLIAFGVLEATNTTHLFRHETPADKVIVKVGNIPAKLQQNSSVSSSQTPPAKNPNQANGNSVAQGGQDTNGNSVATTSPSQWTVSQSGNITVKQPTANATLTSGSVLSGSAKVSTVDYRLIDNNVGVISEGSFNVVNGNFSGTMNFTPNATSGRLDVFSTNDQGVELNEVQIGVTFN